MRTATRTGGRPGGRATVHDDPFGPPPRRRTELIVVDPGIIACALVDDGEDGVRARRRLVAPTDSGAPQAVVVPEAVDLRVADVLSRMVTTARLTPRRAEQALADLADLPLERMPHWPFLVRAWALQDRLSPFGAAMVALAEAFGATLVLSDRKYAVDGLACTIELLEA